MDLLLGGGTSPSHFDRGELAKLPPFNDFIRQNAVESMDDVQPKLIPDHIYTGQCRPRPISNEVNEIRKAVKEIATRKKKEIIESREAKDKKAPAPAATKTQPGKVDVQETDQTSKKPFFENTKIELTPQIHELSHFPEFYPWVHLVYRDSFHPKRRADRA